MAGDMLRRALLVLLSLPLLAADISGSWMFQVEVSGQRGTPKFPFSQKREELTGTYSGQRGEAKVQGTGKGDQVEFHFETQGYRIVYRGTVVSGAEMKGTADFAGQAKGTWTAKKN
jgi:hypothetical protein